MRKRLRTFLIVSVVIVAILAVKAVLFFTAKPKITVNYAAEYNRITRPANYDPNDNAAPYYQKAFDAFVEMPKELQDVPYIIGWLTDFNNTEQTLLEKWLASNSQAFEYFKIAANKPYCWLERQAQVDNNMMTMTFPELSFLPHRLKELMWNAKLAASKGRLQTAFENIIDCYKAGRKKCRTPSLLMKQEVGLDIKQTAIRNAMVILDRVQVDNTTLKFFQDALQAEFNSDTYVLDFTAEKLFLYDALQKTFIDNGKGTGRIYWREANVFFPNDSSYDLWSVLRHGQWYNACPSLNSLIGPTRNEMAEQIEQLLKLFEPLKTQTPWQLHKQGNYLEKMEIIYSNNCFLGLYAPSQRQVFILYHEVKARTEALIAVTAILRFKEDNHRLPATLDELVSAGYLKSIPMDPYSNGPLVYKPDKDNFKLYSVGEDFSDDGGKIYQCNNPLTGSPYGDEVFWPPLRKGRKNIKFVDMKTLKRFEPY